jgi:hypothetical protein
LNSQQLRSRTSRLILVATAALIVAAFFGARAEAQPPPSSEVNFSVPSLFPKFAPGIHDYVVRCNDAPVTVTVHASVGWEVAVATNPFRSGDFSQVVPLGSGLEFTVTVRDVARTQLYRYYVRCLPNSFPTYTFSRYGPVSPEYFSVDQESSRYAIIFDNHGVPMWWYHTWAHATRVLPDGNVLWADPAVSSREWEIHRLNGSLVRVLTAVGRRSNLHDLQFLANGDFLVDWPYVQRHVDTSAYGGSSDADVLNAQLEEVSPSGALVWSWKSLSHISLDETGRHWPSVIRTANSGVYDIVHWNSIEPAGGAVIASFRHLDAVYKIDQSTGNIIWKLGGTSTPRSLTVLNDRYGYTFGGQHDARLLPDGTVTVFDNRTKLSQPPRAVRYQINEQAGTATLLESISDPAFTSSTCCGSARRLDNGDWLIDWGRGGGIGGYKPSGDRTFRLILQPNSYRAEPVPEGAVSAQDLRQAMNTICATGCG